MLLVDLGATPLETGISGNTGDHPAAAALAEALALELALHRLALAPAPARATAPAIDIATAFTLAVGRRRLGRRRRRRLGRRRRMRRIRRRSPALLVNLPLERKRRRLALGLSDGRRAPCLAQLRAQRRGGRRPCNVKTRQKRQFLARCR